MDGIFNCSEFVHVYLYDVVVHSAKHLWKVFHLIKEHKLKLKVTKCNLAQSQLELLGDYVSFEGVGVDSSKIKAVKDAAYPINSSAFRGFLGMASYYRRFIRGLADFSVWLPLPSTRNLSAITKCKSRSKCRRRRSVLPRNSHVPICTICSY